MASSDLSTTEEFHRLKRTCLLLSTALIVLAFVPSVAANGAVQPTTFPSLGSLMIPRHVATWLLWLGLGYYLVGFTLEARVVARDNSAAMSAIEVGRVDDLAGKMWDMVESGRFAMQLATEKLEKEEPANELLEEQYARADPPSRVEQQWRNEHVRLKDALAEQRRRSIDLANAINHVRQSLETIGPQAEQAQQTYRALRRELAIERHLSFWGWQIGGVVVAALLATLAGPVALYAAPVARVLQVLRVGL